MAITNVLEAIANVLAGRPQVSVMDPGMSFPGYSGSSAGAAPPTQQPSSQDVTDMGTPVQPSQPQSSNINDIFNQFKPEHTATDAYLKLLGQYPQRTEPGVGTRIMSVLAGLGGNHPMGVEGGQPVGFVNAPTSQVLQTQDLIRYRPYYHQLADWEAKIKPAEAAALNERYFNQNQRMLANQWALRDTAEKRAGTYAEDVESKIKDRETRATIAESRAKAYAWKQTHPGWKAEILPGQTLKYRNPTDPTQVYDTGLDTGKLSDEDRINLQTEGRQDVAKTVGEEARKTEQTRQTGRETIANQKGWNIYETKDGRTIRYNQDTGEFEDITGKLGTGVHKVAPEHAGATVRPETEAQKKIGDFRRAQEVFNTHPELQKYIHLGSGGVFTIAMPAFKGNNAREWWTANEAEMKRAKDLIYGANNEQPTVKEPNAANPAPSQQSKPSATQTEDRVGVTDLNGKPLGTIKRSDAKTLDTTKYRVVEIQ